MLNSVGGNCCVPNSVVSLGEALNSKIFIMVPISLDRAQSGGRYWLGWFAGCGEVRWQVVRDAANRELGQAGRRSRQSTPRPHLVKFFLTDGELADLSDAARHAGLAKGAFAAEAALTAARGSAVPVGSPLRDALV